MDDFPGLLAKDFGFRAQGKAAPMAGTPNSNSYSNSNYGIGDARSSSFSSTSNRAPKSSSTWNSTPTGNSFLGSDDNLFRSSSSSSSNRNHHVAFEGLDDLNNVYGGGGGGSRKTTSISFDYDAMFQSSNSAKSSSMPVYDKPVYDDDIFDGVPGIKSTSSTKYDDVFTTISSAPPSTKQTDHFDDLLGNFGQSKNVKSEQQVFKDATTDFDDLIPGFGGSSPPKNRGKPEIRQPVKPTSLVEDPFVIIEPNSVPEYGSPEAFTDHLEQIDKMNKPANSNNNSSSGSGVFDTANPLDELTKSVPSVPSVVKNKVEDGSPLRTRANASSTRGAAREEPAGETFFHMSKSASPKVEVSRKSEINVDSADDIWITVSEVPLFTHPTSAPPPARPPPPRPVQVSKTDDGSRNARNAKEKVNDFPSFLSPSYQSPTAVPSSGKSMGVSSVDELEDFAMDRSGDHIDEPVDSSEEELDTNSAAAASAAAMKEAMDRAEAKFKHAREARRENVKTTRNKEATQQEKDEKALRDAQDRESREKQERLDREQREREEKERLDRERRRLDKEREQTRQVVERAAREARERAAAEARQKAQKVAVEKATAEARERAERAAVQRAQAEARERAAAEARQRAEKAAAEARERSNAERAASVARAESEVRARSDRASVDRANAEARERAAAEARERATTAAREHQQNNENDLESFFNMSSRASSAPRPNRTPASESPFDTRFQNRPVPEVPRRTPPGTASTIRKVSSTTNIVDDLSSIFGGPTPSGQFQDIDGETEERRRARLERHQRTQERAAKALAEKNERDLQTQRDQTERNRISETLDIEIKRWSAGKEGNLRALLSTLQYVLWPECGWQPVSLTDLITAAAVKKVYRKATLCIHPDKVQQKGANLQQKYIAEKVFDLLKEAWNKLNSEELF